MSDLLGTKLEGRYLLEELVGEGGMADVYRALDLKEDRIVGVKILRDEFRANDDLVRRFKNEGRAMSVLNHENIIKVYDVSVTEKMEYIVMEYVDGITLKEYIEQRGEPLTYKETIHFITQILLALQHAHDKGIIHRDIKPQNIMLVESGTLRVMDFGIARLARSESHTDSDQAIGSVHYISPEQAKGEATDQRADLYSVGIMMYEMLSGRLPFESKDVVSIAIAQISDAAVPLQEVNRSVPTGLAEITMKAMAKDPRARYPSALAMMRDIEEFKLDPSVKFEYDYLQTNTPTRYVNKVVNDQRRRPPAQPGRPPKSKKKKRRKGLLVPITLAVTAAIVAACFFMIWNMFRTSGNPLFTNYEDIPLPDFVGMQYSEVQDMCKKAPYNYLRIQEPTEENNPNVPAGQVISQNPTSSNDNQKMVKANQRIYLTVSRGVQDISVPDLSGMSRKEAIKRVLELGIRPYAKPQVDTSIPAGTVIGTDPVAGSVIQTLPDTVLTILVASEQRDFARQVPSITGMSLDEARNVVQNAGLTLGPSQEVYSDSAPEGQVVGQSPEPGASAMVGGLVYPTVSMGKDPASSSSSEPESQSTKEEDKPVQVPNVTGGAANTAQMTIRAAGFSVSVVEEYSDSVPEGVVISQDPGGGSMLRKGATVTLVVSRGPEPVSSSEPPPDDPDDDDT